MFTGSIRDDPYWISRKNSVELIDTRKVKVLSLPETIKEKSTFRAKALRRELVVTLLELIE